MKEETLRMGSTRGDGAGRPLASQRSHGLALAREYQLTLGERELWSESYHRAREHSGERKRERQKLGD